jgi:class 3 adenylate cyclase/predicted ATPase
MEAVRIAAAVADALAHAHARLVVHRDVKPANILLGPDGAPVLVDFGLALGEGQAGGDERGVISGTPRYMSPEQAAGLAHRIDGRTDVYSLGVVLYEMLAGRVPFRATEPLELLRQVRDDEPQPPRQLVGDIPMELERVCLKALAKRQEDRHSTAGDFAAELRRVFPMTAETPAPRRVSLALDVREPHTASEAAPHNAVTPPPVRNRANSAEHRQVTVLVCGFDLFESETYLEALDAEDQAKVLRDFQQVCNRSARRFGGTVVQCNERGLLVCFGYPVAYEDGARRAAQTSLGILDDMKVLGARLRGEFKLELTLWCCIHTGPAVVATTGGAVSVVGEARNAAVQLEEFAVPGAVICSESTHRLFQSRFDCVSLSHKKIKGMAQPVELFKLQGMNRAPSGPDSIRLTPLTGRDHEVSLLKERWEQAREGMGQVVLLIGEAGLGKSRLTHALKEHVLSQAVDGDVDAPVVEWSCSPHYQNTGLYPVIDFFERLLRFGREEPPRERLDRLLRHLEEYGLARPEAAPLWAALLSLPTQNRFPPLSLSPSRQREETFQALLEWLHARAARRPTLLVVEDLHWVDASTLEFLGQFIAEGLHDSILTVLTFRPEFTTPWPAVAHQTSLALNRLTLRQVGALMRHKAGDAVPEAHVQQIFARTGGVPLFVEEFAKMLEECGAPQTDAARGTQTSLGREIPATLRDLLMARLDRMESGREVALLASTLGREFEYELLAAVADLDEPALHADLAALERAEILYARGRPPRCSYIFKHALFEDALYNSQVKGTRQQFHRRIAQAFEKHFPQLVETRPELLAHHFTEAGLPEQAADYWLKAGLRSRERSAEHEAIGHLTQGLAQVERLDPSPQRDAQELALVCALGAAYIASRGYSADQVGPLFVRARELGERVGQPRQVFASMFGSWVFHFTRGHLRRCAVLADEGIEFANRFGDRGMAMEASKWVGQTMLYRGDFVRARDILTVAVDRYDIPTYDWDWAAYTNTDPRVANRCHLAMSLWHLGLADQAFRINREMRELARAVGHPFTLAYALHHTSLLHLCCRLGIETQTAGAESFAISTEQGFAWWIASGTFYKGAGMLYQGEAAQAIPWIRKGIQAWRDTGAELILPVQLSALGDACMRSRQFADARMALDEGLAIAERNDERSQEAELYRLKGELLLAETPDQTTEAANCFRQAIETARRQQSKAWELRAAMSLARLWRLEGRHDEAREEISSVYHTFTEGFTTPDLTEAVALLESFA